MYVELQQNIGNIYNVSLFYTFNIGDFSKLFNDYVW